MRDDDCACEFIDCEIGVDRAKVRELQVGGIVAVPSNPFQHLQSWIVNRT